MNLLRSKSKAVFNALKTSNFEEVLGALANAAEVMRVLGQPVASMYARKYYNTVQGTLAGAVKSTHILWSAAQPRFGAIRDALKPYSTVYSINYDLLIYWAIIELGAGAAEFVDLFWNENNEFDPTNASTASNRVLYLHGGLHLEALQSGAARKRTSDAGNLLDEFGNMKWNLGPTPLLVTEGTAAHKMQAIQRSSYLRFALDQLTKHDGDLVIFGVSLSDTDEHLLEAISARARKLAVSVRRRRAEHVRQRMNQLDAKLPNGVVYFEAETHPLGAPSLKVAPTTPV